MFRGVSSFLFKGFFLTVLFDLGCAVLSWAMNLLYWTCYGLRTNGMVRPEFFSSKWGRIGSILDDVAPLMLMFLVKFCWVIL